ncbi:hypothetical protein LEN26_013274 [Aphanomyces euteiches]|nr:hypothetical protein AeMF1_020837 [Aphanomyces euteiches]KAH9112521.1 hypothetical protein LEN26_013274 [Aphanomyces euteiches]KAH9190273.1 hypothetical protein AeNC1_007755 [Aphanomyces euteiches]
MPLLHNGQIQPLKHPNMSGPGEHLLQEASVHQITTSMNCEPEKKTFSALKTDKDNKMTTLKIIKSISGLLYLVFTLVLNSYYLQVLSPSMTNDLWWSSCNASSLIDVYDAQLNVIGNQTISLDLTNNKYALGKDYTQFYTPIEISPVYPRIILGIVAYDLAKFVVGIGHITGPEYITCYSILLD